MRLLVAGALVLLWGTFLALFVPGSLYAGTVLGALVALIVLLFLPRRRKYDR